MYDQGGQADTLRGRELMQKMRQCVNTWRGACLRVTAGILFLTAATLGSAAAEPPKGKTAAQPAQGQQLCPATPGGGTCQVVPDCPPGKAPGKDKGQVSVDGPGTKTPATAKKNPKSE
jgi:hypothetical protein